MHFGTASKLIGITSNCLSGRRTREIKFSHGIKLCGMSAFDFFGDGSFYLLETYGVCICPRWRTKPKELTTFIAHNWTHVRPSENNARYVHSDGRRRLPSPKRVATKQILSTSRFHHSKSAEQQPRPMPRRYIRISPSIVSQGPAVPHDSKFTGWWTESLAGGRCCSKGKAYKA